MFFVRCFATAGPRVWNFLPAELQSCDSLRQGKRCLKTFLFGWWDYGALRRSVKQRRIEIVLLTYLLTYCCNCVFNIYAVYCVKVRVHLCWNVIQKCNNRTRSLLISVTIRSHYTPIRKNVGSICCTRITMENPDGFLITFKYLETGVNAFCNKLVIYVFPCDINMTSL